MRAALRRATLAMCLTAVAAPAGPAAALPAVFQGDPVDGAGKPWVILPGVALLDPGPDGKWLTGDDVVDPGTRGDVDVVVRAGGTYTPGSGVIPAAAASLATAPQVTAGGTLQAASSEVAYQLVVSDGAASPAAGHPLATQDLDGRGALVLAYADLDGDGFIGPTRLDSSAAADDAVELQEALTPVGRRLDVVSAGVAAGTIAVATGLPASKGGLGVVLAGGVITGADSPVFLDGPWIATLLPCLWPIDPTSFVGRRPRPADPLALVDFEYELEDFYCPPPNDPVIGTPFAIPLDGSSITNDLVRAVSGPAVAPGLAVPVSAAGFAATALGRLTPLVAAGGAHAVAEPAGARPVFVADDGPGGGQAQVLVFPADRLGNQADVPFGGSAIELEVTPNLRIVSPQGDADPQRETITFAETGFATVVLDDAGGAGDGGAAGALVARLDGVAGAAVRVSLDGPATSAELRSGRAHLRHARRQGSDRATVTTSLPAIPALDFAARDVALTILAKGVPVVSRTLFAGALQANAAGNAWRYRDPGTVTAARIGALSIRRQAASGSYAVRLLLESLDLTDVDPDIRRITVRIAVGSHTYESSLDCSGNAAGTTTSCVL